MKYTKQPIDIPQQIQLLQLRGLKFDSEYQATEWFSVVSYFRMAEYWRTLEADKVTHQFKPHSRFSAVINLYKFDSELRTLLFAAIQQIEVALRTKMIHNISMQYGAFWFMDETLARSPHFFQTNIDHLTEEVHRSQEDFITEHLQKYDDPALPPVWKTLEVSSFGSLSKLYTNFTDSALKNDIAREFYLRKNTFLSSWLECLTVLRNLIAHHARIWNRRYAVKPIIPRKMVKPWITNLAVQPDKIYPQLCAIAYWLNAIQRGNSFVADFKALLAKYPNVDPAAMGFPRGWEHEPLWQ